MPFLDYMTNILEAALRCLSVHTPSLELDLNFFRYLRTFLLCTQLNGFVHSARSSSTTLRPCLRDAVSAPLREGISSFGSRDKIGIDGLGLKLYVKGMFGLLTCSICSAIVVSNETLEWSSTQQYLEQPHHSYLYMSNVQQGCLLLNCHSFQAVRCKDARPYETGR